MEPVRWPPQQPVGDPTKDGAACVVGTQVVHHVRGGHVLVPHWMAAVAQAFSQWIESWVVQNYPTFRERSRTVSAQSWATVRGTMVRSPDGRSEPWLQVFTDHPAVGNVTGWPVKYCRSTSNRCGTSQFWRWPHCLMWGRCGCMTGSCGGSFQRQQVSSPWPYC